MNFIFFTKTKWSEPPRLRHQLANLLIDNGHNVIFVEKPSYSSRLKVEKSSGKMYLIKYRQLIHHKLRLGRLLRFLNAKYEQRNIKIVLEKLNTAPDVVINFNYDYYFLPTIFNIPIFTIINDAFWERTLYGLNLHMKRQLEMTLAISDRVFTVSKPLESELSQFCNPILFRPWLSDSAVCNPVSDNFEKNVVLFWGYINRRLDFEYIRKFIELFDGTKGIIKFRFIGPIENDVDDIFHLLVKNGTIEHLPECHIKDVVFDDVFLSIIPYKDSYCESVTDFPNKLLPLLSAGLPIVHLGMPQLVQTDFIVGLTGIIESDVNVIYKLREDYMNNGFQNSISEFVRYNTASIRYEEFMRYVYDSLGAPTT